MVSRELILKSLEESITKCHKSEIDSSNGVSDTSTLYKFLSDKFGLKIFKKESSPNSNLYHQLSLKDKKSIFISKGFVENDIQKWLKNGTASKHMSNLIEEYQKLPKKIKLTIQEIVCDFERMIRHHERLDVHFDFEKADENEIDEFHDEMLGLMEKYLPDYQKHVPEDYLKEETPTFDRALILYGELYRNFREIFFQLV